MPSVTSGPGSRPSLQQIPLPLRTVVLRGAIGDGAILRLAHRPGRLDWRRQSFTLVVGMLRKIGRALFAVKRAEHCVPALPQGVEVSSGKGVLDIMRWDKMNLTVPLH
jgi:hypothetical protein